MIIPSVLLQSLENVKGFNRTSFENVHELGEQVTSIRLNPAKSATIGFPGIMNSVPWCPHGFYLSKRPSFTLDPLIHAGAYYVQDASSMFLWHALKESIENDLPKIVLDLCAAPGGKSTLLASYFTNGLVVANEVIKARAAVLIENITKWGSDNVIVTNNDPSHFQSLPGYFDAMVIDAPCSGSGLFRKDAAAIHEWSESNVQLCSQRQQRILADVLPALKEGGLLIYSTCSYSPDEDEAIADWLITEMQMQSIQVPFPDVWGIVETESNLHKAFGYRFFPDQIKGEGFYLAVFQKKGNAVFRRLKEQKLIIPSKKEEEQINSLILIPESFSLFKQTESIRALKKEWFAELQKLANCLYIRKAGIEIGNIKGRDVIPSHELSVSFLSKTLFYYLELSLEEALQYLRRNELKLENAPLGWNMVSFGGLPLGWVKVLPNRVNNYYPAAWRILK